jgi:hypothetical protein
LAAEFQGFTRDLHDAAAETFAREAASGNAKLEQILRGTLVESRRIDRGNADKSGLADDFARFGIAIWPRLERQHRQNAQRARHLENLNKARNAIAHDDQEKFAELRTAGYALDLHNVRQWRQALHQLAVGMDTVVADHLTALFGAPALL